ncbi:MAG TPA: signal recognition particle protein [Acidimicrobiaceae bacterium]|nr:signal recognition particle protein [Acidimicrobiaceae bacterium]
MFDALTRRFEGVFGRLRGRGRLSEADIDSAMDEIRLALLEADVNLGVVASLVERVRARCAAAEVSAGLSPGQQVVKVVDEELTATLGGDAFTLSFAAAPPTVILLAGLQGVGKTTAAAKLANWVKTQGRNPMLVGADLQRPAAVEQLRTLAARIDVPVWSAAETPSKRRSTRPDPVAVSAAGLAEARRVGRDVLIVDTAGRLAVDAEMMTEVARVSDAVSPHCTFLVLDAMAGQDAVASAGAFHATLEVDAVIVSKLDGDARGGAALSVSEVLGRPIAFASVGEALDDFEQFHPDRMASRILGMGDVMSLIEKAERVYETDQAEEAVQRLVDGSFTLDDFVDQLRQVRRMGSLSGLMAMVPGVPAEMRDADLDDGRIETAEAIVLSMTPTERAGVDTVDGSRRARIAAGSGTTTGQVANLLKQFGQMRKMMSSMGGSGKAARRGRRNGTGKPNQPAGAGRDGAGRVRASKRTGGGTNAKPKSSSRPGPRPGLRGAGVPVPDFDSLDIQLPRS